MRAGMTQASLREACAAAYPTSTLPHALQLTHLDIAGCSRACEPDAFARLQLLHSLRRLIATDCRLGPQHAATLTGLTALEELRLADNPDLMSLESLSSLRYCNCS